MSKVRFVSRVLKTSCVSLPSKRFVRSHAQIAGPESMPGVEAMSPRKLSDSKLISTKRRPSACFAASGPPGSVPVIYSSDPISMPHLPSFTRCSMMFSGCSLPSESLGWLSTCNLVFISAWSAIVIKVEI